MQKWKNAKKTVKGYNDFTSLFKQNDWVLWETTTVFKTRWKDTVYFYNTFQGPVEKLLRVLSCSLEKCCKNTLYPFTGHWKLSKDTMYFTSLFKKNDWVQWETTTVFKARWKDTVLKNYTFQGPVEKLLKVLTLYNVFCNTLVTVFKFRPKDTLCLRRPKVQFSNSVQRILCILHHFSRPGKWKWRRLWLRKLIRLCSITHFFEFFLIFYAYLQRLEAFIFYAYLRWKKKP